MSARTPAWTMRSSVSRPIRDRKVAFGDELQRR
jgi:hypothetical protein